MGNIGRPSRGCILCRKRRVKCDQRKPGCLRCAKVDKECPGYVHPEKWIFVSQKEDVDTTKYGGPTPDTDDGCSLSGKSSPSGDLSSPKEYKTFLFDEPIPALADDFDTRSLHLFLRTWSTDANPNDPHPAHLDFLPSLYANSSSHSCIRKAVSLVACQNFINRCHAPAMNWLANKKYSEALFCLNKALADPLLVQRDETIASVYLIGLHELMTPDFVSGSWQIHTQGMLHLLRLRGVQQLSHPRGQQLFRLVHTPILLAALRSSNEPPAESKKLVQWIQTSSRSPSIAVPSLGAKYMFKVIALRAHLKRLIDSARRPLWQSTHRQLIMDVVSEGQMLDLTNDIVAWTEDSSLWKAHQNLLSMKALPGAEDDDLTNCDPRRFHFRSLWAMAHWVRPWTTCLYLNDSLVEAVEYVSDSTDDDILSHEVLDDIIEMFNKKAFFQSRVQHAADNILGCIGFAFGEINSSGVVSCHSDLLSACTTPGIGPLYILYALQAVVASTSTTAAQQSVAMEALQKITEQTGMKNAFLHFRNDA